MQGKVRIVSDKDKKKDEIKTKDQKIKKEVRQKPRSAKKAQLKPTKLCSAPDFPYHNRELSWMDFNSRVLEEAFEKDNPILERHRILMSFLWSGSPELWTGCIPLKAKSPMNPA